MDDKDDTIERLYQCITLLESEPPNFVRLDCVFQDLINFWQDANVSFLFKNTLVYITKVLSATLIESVTKAYWKKTLTESQLLEIFNLSEKKLKAIKDHCEFDYTIFCLELEEDIAYFREKKLILVHLTPRNNVPKPCWNIIEESTASLHYTTLPQWLWIHYIPNMRYGLPHIPCIAYRGAVTLDKRNTFKQKLEQATREEYPAVFSEMGPFCVFCKDEFAMTENFTIVDCCNHLVCEKCNTRQSWKEWYVAIVK